MRVLITGGSRGQLRHELLRTAPGVAEIVGLGESRLDITDATEVKARVAALSPDLIINAAAYTAVDRAESDRDLAFAVNATAVENLAEAASACRARMIHVSTDFVFGGACNGARNGACNGACNGALVPGRPIRESDTPCPLGVYGESKLAGERAVRERLPVGGCTIRTSWVYSAHGSNFVKTMLGLMNDRDELGVVADQIGSPTWAHSLAIAIWRTAELALEGTLHWCDKGVASWYDLAVATLDEGSELGLIARAPTIRPIRTEDYPTPAARPAYSVLDTTESCRRLDLNGEHWRHALKRMLIDLT